MKRSQDEGPAPETPNPVGRTILEGRRLVTYLWQAPHDEAVRDQLRRVLAEIRNDYREHTGPRTKHICEELLLALRATPSPQQVDLLEDGFNRLYRIWNGTAGRLKKRMGNVA